jgi:hypothetical protein
MRSLGAALGCLAGASGLIAFAEAAMLWPDHQDVSVLFPAAGVIYAVAGLIAWWRRPSNRIGPIMTTGSLIWFIAGLSNTTVPVLIAAGVMVASAPLAIVVHLLHAFPSGRLRTRGSFLTVLAAYAVALMLQAPLYLFAPAASPGGMLAIADQLRELVHNVMPALLVERGLAAAAEELADQMPLPVQMDLEVDGQLTATVASTAYFMVAEGLGNAVKHACATKLTVRITRQDHLLTVQVGDNGKGGATVHHAGLGLRSIADRLGALGGRLEIDSQAGKGTRLLAEIPCG